MGHGYVSLRCREPAEALLNRFGATTISRFTYTYDAVGNRITRTTTNGIANYTYDTLNRLTQATQPNPVDPLQTLTESFAYDPVGNRTSSHLATGQILDAANRLLEDSNFTYAYDANGNLTSKTSKATGEVTTYTYDVENRLIQVTMQGTVATYRYDPLGRRIEKNVNGIITRYIYDQEDILLELDGGNQVIARYTQGSGIDEPLIMLRNGQSFFYHIDGLGSVWDLTDSTGISTRSYTYDSFGQLLAQTGTAVNPYTYTARELDPETGFYYYRARYYDPTNGRFLQEDPISGFIGLPQSLNKYPYAANSPINFADPSGLVPVPRPPVVRPRVPRVGGPIMFVPIVPPVAATPITRITGCLCPQPRSDETFVGVRVDIVGGSYVCICDYKDCKGSFSRSGWLVAGAEGLQLPFLRIP